MKRLRVAVLLMAPLAWAWAGRSIDETRPALANGEVSIEIVSGSLKIFGWDRDEIRVTGTIGDDVEEFIFEVDDDDAEIKVKVPRRRRGNVDGHARLEISLPAQSRLEASTISAPITVTGVVGPEIELEVINGKVNVEDCRGDLRVEAVNGEIDIAGDHESVDVESVSGRIIIRQVSREVNAETVSGTIEVYGGAIEECKLESVSGRIHYEGGLAPNGEMDVEGFNGAVEINFTSEVSGRYQIETFNGAISTNFGPEPERKSRFAPGRELDFEHGNGGARIKVSSFNGRVSINIPK